MHIVAHIQAACDCMKDIEREGFETCRHARVINASGTRPRRNGQNADRRSQIRKPMVNESVLNGRKTLTVEKNERKTVIE